MDGRRAAAPDAPAAIGDGDRVRDRARVAALRALCLYDGRSDAAFDRITRLAARILSVPAALVNVVDAERQVTRSAYDASERFRRGDELGHDDSICRLVVASGEPLVIADARGDARVAHTASVTGGVAAYAGVPLTLSSGHTLGTLCVVDDRPRPWSASDLAVLTDLAAAATTELELVAATRAAEGRAAAEANARRLQAVLDLTDVALNHATLDDTLDAILARLRDLLSTDTATLLLLEPDRRTLRVRASLGIEGEGAGETVVPVGEGIAGRIAATREPTIVPDVAAADPVSPLRRREVRSLLGAPLLLAGELLGVVHVGTRAARAFDEDDVRLLELAAQRVAAAVERARLFDAEHEARLAAEAASRAKSGFLAVMSHELRTPLNAIGGFAELLADGVGGPLTADQRGMLARIRAGQRRLTEVIDDILQYVELERDAPPTRGGTAPLRAALAEVAAGIAARATASGLALEVEACGPEVTVDAPVEAIADILRRVADNAVKFTPRGGSVWLRCAVRDDTVAVTVADTGPGIPAERLASVFEPFRHGASSYRRAHDGVGLGLAIARARARQIGATLDAASRPDGGAAFTLTVPRRRVPDR